MAASGESVVASDKYNRAGSDGRKLSLQESYYEDSRVPVRFEMSVENSGLGGSDGMLCGVRAVSLAIFAQGHMDSRGYLSSPDDSSCSSVQQMTLQGQGPAILVDARDRLEGDVVTERSSYRGSDVSRRYRRGVMSARIAVQWRQ